jgi:tetratricopeptide (TPR) repeat protein
MEELIKISKVLTAYRLRQIDIVGNEDSESRYSEFFKLIKDGTLKSDTEASQHFYGEQATDRSFTYRQFKNTFRERLLNTLFFIDMNHPNFSDLETATMQIHKEWAAINILFTKNEIRLPVALAEELLPMAIKYELTEIVVYITDRLKDIYGGQIGDIKKYTYYKRLQKEHMEIWQAEIQAKDLFQELRMRFIKSAAYQPEVSRIAEQGLAELHSALEKYRTLRLIFYAYGAKVAQYTTVADFQKAIELCDEAINIFESKPYTAQRVINSFLNQKLVCLIRLRDYYYAQSVIDKIVLFQAEGSLGWFKTLEHTALLAFHTKNYEDAYHIYVRVKKHENFVSLELRNLEIWHLYKAYLYFLISIDEIKKATVKSEEFVDFKLNRFLNDVNIFGRDSAGMKISVLIIETALNLMDEKFGKMIDAVDALAKYRQRHLSKTHALYRHNIMIKMICQIPRSGFSRQEVKRVTEVPFREMKKIPMAMDAQSFVTEIIPLDDMWNFIVDTLRNDDGRPRKKPSFR